MEVVKLSDFIPWVDTVPLPEVDLDGSDGIFAMDVDFVDILEAYQERSSTIPMVA